MLYSFIFKHRRLHLLFVCRTSLCVTSPQTSTPPPSPCLSLRLLPSSLYARCPVTSIKPASFSPLPFPQPPSPHIPMENPPPPLQSSPPVSSFVLLLIILHKHRCIQMDFPSPHTLHPPHPMHPHLPPERMETWMPFLPQLLSLLKGTPARLSLWLK